MRVCAMRVRAMHTTAMAWRMRLSFMLSMLALQLVLVSTSDRGQTRTSDGNGRTRKVIFKFTYDGNATTCQYKDPHFGLVKVAVPRFMRHYSGDRIGEELNYYLLSKQRWSQRVVLELLYYALSYGTDYKPPEDFQSQPPCLKQMRNWMDLTVDVCDWEGITCGDTRPSNRDQPRIQLKFDGTIDLPYSWDSAEEPRWPTPHLVTKIDLPEFGCPGTLPEELFMLTELRRLNLRGNLLQGTIPSTYGDLVKLGFLDLSSNRLGGVPWQLSKLYKNLQELWLDSNVLEGPIHFYLTKMKKLSMLDVSDNMITGTIPSDVGHLSQIVGLFLYNNRIAGVLPTEIAALTRLQYLYIQQNRIEGTIPTELGRLSQLKRLQMELNKLTGTFPAELTNLESLEELSVADNRLIGSIPDDNDIDGDGSVRWSRMSDLGGLDVSANGFTGTFPVSLLVGLSMSLTLLDIGFNSLAGTLPSELGLMTELIAFSAPYNSFSGTLPIELGRLSSIQVLNLTSNKLRGFIPDGLCGEESWNEHVPVFGCDAILCPPGTFHPHGAADNNGACRVCQRSIRDGVSPVSNYLGQTTCKGSIFLIGDADGDGMQSPREILNYFFLQNGGMHWGAKFSDWIDSTIPDCELPGITCSGSEIAQIDLTDAAVCSDRDGNEAPDDECHGIPAELSLLSNLEVIWLRQRSFLRGSIPSEIGLLSKLRILNLSYCPRLVGSIPTEIGRLLNMQDLNLANSQFSGAIPSELFNLPHLEKLHLNANRLTGSIPEEIGRATSLMECFLGRLPLTTTIPTTIGQLSALQSLELDASAISGTIPSEIGNCSALLGLHMSNNRLTGTLPSTLAQIRGLQVFHLKNNHLTGRLPEEIGNLHYLTWIDVSFNAISGTIPSSYGHIRTLKDVRLGGNRLHDPIPQALCASVQINGGRTRSYGCDGILCPLGYYHAEGFADDSNDSCTKCPNGKTTIYLGSVECVDLHVEDLLSMLHDVMGGELWDKNDVFRWNTEVNICHW